ncbi:MAG: hypothetical protein LBN21_03695 [Treponema sp.]|nr:hypothetical protein [Treponema sp.]
MNHKTLVPLFCVIFFALAFASCASSGKSAQNQAQDASPYFSGAGGKGVSIAILAPKASGLAKDQDYLPGLVQGDFVNNFKTYSAIEVLDRERLDDQYAELLSGYYDDTSEAGLDLGHLIPTAYLMTGNITRTAAGYALQIQITKTADKMTAASYSGTCTFAELDNLTLIRQASLDLLGKMGVTPTEKAQAELAGAAAANHVNAQTTLAKGITAQQRGGEVEALTYYYQAAAYDPSLLEAASRVSVLAANISSGNIGDDARNDVRWRRDWIARLDEANKFFANYIASNQPICEIVYSTNMETGKVDYSSETMPFTFPVRLFTGRAYFASLEKSIQAVTDGLAATKRNDEWRLNWPGNLAGSRSVNYDIDFDLANDAGKAIGTQRIRLGFQWYISGGEKIEVTRPIPGTEKVTINAKVDGITDTLTIKVRAVNGRAPSAANVRISMTNEAPPPDNAYGFDLIAEELYAAPIPNYSVIPASIWGAPVTSIGDDCELIPRYNKTRMIWSGIWFNDRKFVVIPDSVKRIGKNAIIMDGTNSISIGADVLLHENAFYRNLRDDNGKIFKSYYFASTYNENGKKAGTYLTSVYFYSDKWKYEP